MSVIEDRLQQSVGLVLSATDVSSDAFKGTAFLFRQDGDAQYWFTCFHVVKDLPARHIAFRVNDQWETAEASYVEDSSAPLRDVAVLKTTSAALRTREPIFMGDRYAGYTTVPAAASATVYGYAPSPASPDIIELSKLSSTFDDFGQRTYSLKGEVTAPIRAYILRQGLQLTPGLSGSPVCYEDVRGQLVCLGMFAQIYSDRSQQPQNGIVVKFNELYAAARTLIPFFPYADFLLVTIAATKHEMMRESERGQTTADPEWRKATGRADFYGDTREDWRPFADRAAAVRRLVELLADARLEGTAQLGAAYFERDPDELKAAVLKFASTTFLLDPCSVAMPCLSRLVQSVDSCAVNKESRYWSLCCKERVDRISFVRAAHEQVKNQLPTIMRVCPSHFHPIEDVETLLDWLQRRLVRYSRLEPDPEARGRKLASIAMGLDYPIEKPVLKRSRAPPMPPWTPRPRPVTTRETPRRLRIG